MPQQASVDLPGGRKGIVIVPDGKKVRATKYQEKYHNVVVHYEPPDDKEPDLANGVNGVWDMFIVPKAFVPDME